MLFTNVFSVYLLCTFLSGNISIRVSDFRQTDRDYDENFCSCLLVYLTLQIPAVSVFTAKYKTKDNAFRPHILCSCGFHNK